MLWQAACDLFIPLSEQHITTAMLDNGHIRKDMYTQAFEYNREKYCHKDLKNQNREIVENKRIDHGQIERRGRKPM